MSRNLDTCLTIDDLREAARRRLPAALYTMLTGAAEQETTLDRNSKDFERLEILPRCLVDVAAPRTATEVLGQRLAFPLYCSPTGASRLFHPDGELAVARAAAAAGTLYGLSTVATHMIEAVAAASTGPKLFQTFVLKDRALTHQLVDRAAAAGFAALCVTVDTPARGNCVRERRIGLGQRMTLRRFADFATHPRWSIGQLRRGRLGLPFVAEATGLDDFAAHSRFIGEQLDPSLSWPDIAALRAHWTGPFAIKGIMTADDARRAVDAGASAVIVSNHGGRQLDGAASAIAALPAIAEAAGGQCELILDGGIRRGVDILRALALGAKAVSVGRAYLFGLAAGGEAGVARALDILRAEFVLAMKLAGCGDLEQIDAGLMLQPAGSR